jgi:hypothetical protein
MALQALAKYRDDPAVKAASEKALAFLSGLQNGKGGYTGGGDVNSESVVQVLVALCELGIGVDDPRFVKNGYTLADNIISFQNADGSFRHTSDGQGNNMMSSEQAFYGLVAAQRARDGKNPLYRMSDAVKRGGAAANTPGAAGLAGKNAEVSPVPVISPQKTFTDIQNHASKTAISALAARGILNGSTDTVFDPDAGVTRAQFAAIVTRALGLPEKTGTPFADVQDGQWYAKPVATAYFYKIAAGVSDSSFDPAGTVTRQEAAVMVARAAKLCGLGADPSDEEIRDGLAQFDDYRTVADWARPALAFCFSEGLIDDSALDIEPEKPATRAEIAEMLYRLLDRAELL